VTDWDSLYQFASTIDVITVSAIIGAAFSYFCMPFVKHKKHALAAGAAYFMMLNILFYIPVAISNFTVYGLSVLVGLLVLCLLEHKNILQKIFLAVVFFSVRWLVMAIGGCLYVWMCQISVKNPQYFNDLAFQFKQYVFNCIINNIVDLVLLFAVSWIIGKAYKYSDEDMKKDEFLLLMLPSMSGLVGYAMMKFYDNNYKADTGYDLSEVSISYNLMCLCYYMVSLIAIIVLILLYQNIKEKQEEAKQNELLNSQIESMKHHIGRVERLYTDIRGLRHDMGNHITTLEALYETGKGAAADEYMEKLKQELRLSDSEVKSGNPVTDVILSERRQEAQELGIEFVCEFRYPDSETINAFDISVILNNALDNAIRAAKRVVKKGGRARIRIHSYAKNEVYMLEIENDFDNDSDYGDRAKADARQGHGYGLPNIKKVAQKYCGDMLIEHAGGVFKLSVMLVQ